MGGWNFTSLTSNTDMFLNITLPNLNYSDLLIAIDTNPPMAPLSLDVGATQYTTGPATTAHTNLSGDGWGLIDGGQAP
jgi:hypothetical protein